MKSLKYYTNLSLHTVGTCNCRFSVKKRFKYQKCFQNKVCIPVSLCCPPANQPSPQKSAINLPVPLKVSPRGSHAYSADVRNTSGHVRFFFEPHLVVFFSADRRGVAGRDGTCNKVNLKHK